MPPLLRFADRIFSILPLFIIIYHVLGLLRCSRHAAVLASLAITHIQSTILKALFKKDRRTKSYEFAPLVFSHYFHRIKSHYGFPSSHAMFYFQYFLLIPSLGALIVFVCGASLRIFCEHHRRREVFFGCVAVLISKLLARLAYWVYSEAYRAR